MNIENLDPGESSVIEDNTSEIMVDKNEECACGVRGKRREAITKTRKNSLFIVEIKVLI